MTTEPVSHETPCTLLGPQTLFVATSAPRFTDQCTWWLCPRSGSIMFGEDGEPIAHLCDTHAGLFARRPSYWRGVATDKLKLDGTPREYTLAVPHAIKHTDGTFEVLLPGEGWA